MKFDCCIKGGLLLDGSGKKAFQGDVGITGDRITAIGALEGCDADVVNAAGCYVAPGFIDVHSHSDTYILLEPSAASKIYQGVTTEIVGQCGASAAPLMGDYKMPSDWRAMQYPGVWSSLEEYRELLAEQHPAVNIAMLTGHNTLRAGVMGYAPRPATVAEIDCMKNRLQVCLEAGSRGLSSGLLYPPGNHAAGDELYELAAVVAAYDGVYATHMRSEGSGLLKSIREVLDVGRRTGVRLQVSHLKTSGPENWNLLDQAFELIEEARGEGLIVYADRYPYTAACTDLDVLLPDWVFAEGPSQELCWLRDPVMRARIRAEVLQERAPEYWKRVLIGTTVHPEHVDYKGLPLLRVAEKMGLEPVDAMLQLLDKDDVKTGGIFFGMNEENMWRILAKSYVMIGSDASLRAPTGVLSQDHPHPRAYGTFAKLLKASLQHKTVPLEELIRKMTALPAAQFGLKDRGMLRVGARADVVVFGDQVADQADYEHPHRLATGMQTVFVNGVKTLADGKETTRRGGLFI